MPWDGRHLRQYHQRKSSPKRAALAITATTPASISSNDRNQLSMFPILQSPASRRASAFRAAIAAAGLLSWTEHKTANSSAARISSNASRMAVTLAGVVRLRYTRSVSTASTRCPNSHRVEAIALDATRSCAIRVLGVICSSPRETTTMIQGPSICVPRNGQSKNRQCAQLPHQ